VKVVARPVKVQQILQQQLLKHSASLQLMQQVML